MAGRKSAVQLTAEELVLAADASREYRKQHRLTQQQFAYQLGSRLADISAIENRYHRRNSRIVRAILDLCGYRSAAAEAA